VKPLDDVEIGIIRNLLVEVRAKLATLREARDAPGVVVANLCLDAEGRLASLAARLAGLEVRDLFNEPRRVALGERLAEIEQQVFAMEQGRAEGD